MMNAKPRDGSQCRGLRRVAGGALAIGLAMAGPDTATAGDAPVQSPTTPATVSVKAGSGATRGDGFLGLSFEVNLLVQPGLTQGNLVQYLKTLGSGVLRFGGNQVDKAFWTSTGEKAPPWAATTLTPEELKRLSTLAKASGWKVILGVALKQKDAARAADEARWARRILGDSLLAIEVGNEANYYAKELPGYGPARYYADFEEYREAIAKTAPGVGLLGPSGGSATNAVPLLTEFAKLQEANPKRNLESLSTHFYPACGRSTPTPTMADLLSLGFRDRIKDRVQRLVDSAKPLGAKARLTEANSLTCGGVDGVSDRYGAALWAVDQGLLVASLGVTGENFHSNIAVCGGPKPPGSAYTPFCAANATDQAAGRLIPQPEYYGLLMLREVGTGTFAPTESSDPETLRAHALRNGKRLRVVLVNLQDPSSARERKVSLELGAKYGHAEMVRLSGPALDATSGITLGGRGVGNDGRFPSVTPTPLEVSGDALTLVLPAASATLVTLKPSAEPRRAEVSEHPLVVNTYYSDPAYERAFAGLVARFEAQHPEIDVTVNTVDGGKFAALLKTWLPTPNPPDVVAWHPSQKLWSLTAQDLVEPIDDVFPGGFDASFPERMKALCSYRGKIYLVPQSWYWWGVYFNKDVFARHQIAPPSNWKEFLHVCARLKANQVTPIALSTKEPWALAGWFDHLATAAFGGAFRDALMAGDIPYTDPRVRKTLLYLTDLGQRGYLSERHATLGPEEAARQVAEGEAGMVLVGQSMIAGLPVDRRTKLEFFRFPAIEGHGSYVEMPIDGYLMPKNAPHKPAARKLLRFLAAREQQAAFCRPLGLMAAHKGIPPRDPAAARGLRLVEAAAGTMQHYDRDTPEAMATKGMDAFIQILVHPERIETILADLDQDRRRLFNK